MIRQKVVSFIFGLLALCASIKADSLGIPEVGGHELKVITPTLLELSLVTTKEPDPARVAQWDFVQNNTVSLPAVTEFAVEENGTARSVTQVGFKRRVLYAPLKARDLRIGNHLYLSLAAPLQQGSRVTVRNPAGRLWSDASVQYAATVDPVRYSPAIHVNQVGYQLQHPKKAMVGYYLGSMGELPLSATAFSILDAQSRSPVFNGTLRNRRDVGYTYSPLPYQQVFEADFSALQSPGEYVLQVPGLGISQAFRIDDAVGGAFAKTYALGLYHQRCGCENVLPFTRHEHAACHTRAAEIPTMEFSAVNSFLASYSSDYANFPRHTAPQLRDVNSSLYPFVRTGTVDVSRGHHDAGDYSKYTINSASLIHHLVFAADSLQGVGALDNLGLPESGDGISDILQEAKWEADFLAKMQDQDGGFYFLVYPRNRAYEDDVLPDNSDPQVVFPKTTAATAAAVGALAEIASSPRFRQAYPAEAAAYLQKAQAGWTFLMNAIARFGKDGSYQKITHYGNEFMHDDELAWAAAALFVATGEAQYHNQLKGWYNPEDPNTLRWGWWRLFEGYGAAARSYAFAARSGRLAAGALDPLYLAKCEAEIARSGDDIARFAQQTAYGTSFPDPTKAYRSAGWYFSLERAFETAAAAQIRPSAAYTDALVSNLNYEAGSNPLNLSYITGLGYKRWRDIVHQYAQNDTRTLPPSGIPVGNIHASFAGNLAPYGVELNRLTYPSDNSTTAPYPFYDRSGDSFNTTTEFVIVDSARGLATAALLFAQSTAASAPSRNLMGSIAGLPQQATALQPVIATFAVEGLDVSVAKVVWDVSGQEPFIGSSFTFAPPNPGTTTLEVEAQWPDGTRAFARATLAVNESFNLPPNSFQSAPVATNSTIAALYHLENTADATGVNGPLQLQGNARLDSLNLAWMAARSGTALRVDDLGDKATATISAGALFKAGTEEIALEAMIYINTYKAYGRAPAKLLSLNRGWNAYLELMEDPWSGPRIRGGTQFDLGSATVNAAIQLRRWHHVSIRINTTEYSLYVDGARIASAPASELNNWAGGSAVLEIGNFDGWIDEVVVRSRSLGGTPTVRIDRPTVGQTFNAPASVALESTASDTDGQVAKVEYFAGATKLGEATTAPYRLQVNDLATGNYTFTAVAVDDQGNRSPNASVTFSVVTALPTAPTGFTAETVSSSEIRLRWTDQSINEDGFAIYRSLDGSIYDLTATVPANTTTWSNTGLAGGMTYHYALISFNAAGESARVFASASTAVLPPATPTGVTATASPNSVVVAWNSSATAASYTVRRSTTATTGFTVVASNLTTTSWTDSTVTAGATYYYTVTASNAGGESAPSSAVSATVSIVPAASVSFLGLNTTRKGTWRNAIGRDGYTVIGDTQRLPSYGTVTATGKTDHIWNSKTSDTRALQKATGNQRVAAAWYSGTSFNVNLAMNDQNSHRVALYCLDWDRAGRVQRVEIVDTATGVVLHTHELSNFSNGTYLEYNVRGNVTVRFTKVASYNAVLSGIFFDPATN